MNEQTFTYNIITKKTKSSGQPSKKDC